ncbi:MAG: hypothetical protein JOZ24_12260 [Candidatus Eremiobacteraeota bacterium]|nr:hypothetical protein [Candidatus Eremiobacteraeota bacterium]
MAGERGPALDHLAALTDDVGVLQHAVLDVANRSSGYCTDDVARALIVSCDAGDRDAENASARRLVSTYLAFLHDAQLSDGWFHAFLGYDRRWQDHRGSEDAVGRAVWGLGYAERHAPRATWRALAGRMRRRALSAIAGLTAPRARAYAALGLVHALAAEPVDEAEVRDALRGCVTALADAYTAESDPSWDWCEPVLTYDNARLPEALLRGAAALDDERFARSGLAMLEFYARVTIVNGVFRPVGNDGWYPRGGIKARWDEQPLEAAAMCSAALAALEVAGDARWRTAADVAHGWYYGRNSRRIRLVDDTGGCCDGLGPHGPNQNRGAESTISFLMTASAATKRATSPLRLVR